MAFDRDKWRNQRSRVRDAAGRGSKLLKIPVGDNYYYIMPPCEETMGVPFVEVVQHRNVGPAEKSVVCLDADANAKLWENPYIVARFKEKGIEIGDCPCCRIGRETDMSKVPAYIRKNPELISKMERKATFFAGVVHWGEFRHGKRIDFVEEKYDLSPQPAAFTGQLADSIAGIIDKDGEIWSFDRAILITINRVGTGMTDTRYRAEADTVTIRTPLVVPKPIKAAILKSQGEKGDCNLPRLVAAFAKKTSDIEALLEGAETTERQISTDKPECFAADYEGGSPECQKCRAYKECGDEVAKQKGTAAASKPAPVQQSPPQSRPELAPEDGPPEEAPPDDGPDGELPFDADPAPQRQAATGSVEAKKAGAATDDLEAALNRRRHAQKQ